MSDYFMGEIRMFPWNWPPQNWALCNGALLSVQQNAALFSLLGNTYGGDAQATFALPNLQGRAALGVGSTYDWGETGGEETVSLSPVQTPAHTHPCVAANEPATIGQPGTNYLAYPVFNASTPTPVNLYASPTAANLTQLDPNSVSAFAGGVQGHDNMQPFLAMNYCIAMEGIYPPRS